MGVLRQPKPKSDLFMGELGKSALDKNNQVLQSSCTMLFRYTPCNQPKEVHLSPQVPDNYSTVCSKN